MGSDPSLAKAVAAFQSASGFGGTFAASDALVGSDTDEAGRAVLDLVLNAGIGKGLSLASAVEQSQLSSTGPFAGAFITGLGRAIDSTKNIGAAVRCARALNEDRALSEIVTPERVAQNSPCAVPLLSAFGGRRSPWLTREQCTRLARSSKIALDEGRHAGLLLVALAPVASDSDWSRIESFMDASPYFLADGARGAWLKRVKLYGALESINELDVEFERYPRPVHDAALAVRALNEWGNGELEQYWSNSTGDSWKSTLRAAKQTGATSLAAAIEGSARAFGKRGPSKDREKREDQLDGLLDADESVFDPFDELIDQNADLTGITRFVAEHASEFHRAFKRA